MRARRNDSLIQIPDDVVVATRELEAINREYQNHRQGQINNRRQQ